MKHIPFAALPPAERQAVMDALLRSGVSPRQVCVSRMEPSSAAEGDAVTTVTAPNWYRSYGAAAGWTALLERDLIALRPKAPAEEAQSGLQNNGDPG